METYNEALRRQHTQQGLNLWNFNRVNSVATLQPIRQNITVVVCDAATMHEHLSELKSSVRTTPHAPLGPTHPRKCSVSPRQKTAPSLHASTSSVTDPVSQPPPSTNPTSLLLHATTWCTHTVVDTDMHMHTQWLSKWQTHAYLLCHSSEHTHNTHVCVRAHTCLTVWLTSMATSNHIPHGCRHRGGENNFPKLAQHWCEERD